MRRILGILPAVALVLACAASGHTPGPTTQATTSASIAPSPSAKPSSSTAACAAVPPVYHPARLTLLQGCVAFRGVVLADLRERDGDRHLWLAPDAGYEGFLNAANVYTGHRALVAEIVPLCASAPADEAAAAACPPSKLGAPMVGSHVELTGPEVLDTVHSWQEIHPVASLKILPR